MSEILDRISFPAKTGLLIFMINWNSEKSHPADELEVYPQAPFQVTRT